MQQRDVAMSSYSGMPFYRVLNPTVIGRMPNFYLPCKDGYVVIAAFLDHQWRILVEAMGSPGWALSEAFAGEAERTANWVEMRLHLMEWTMNQSGDELCEVAAKRSLPFFPFYPIRKVVDSDQVQYRKSLADVAHMPPGTRMPGSPIDMQGTPWAFRRPAPSLGEHTREVLRDWLGFADSDVHQLFASGVV